MSKREAIQITTAGVDVDAPRAKRRREAPGSADASGAKEGDAGTSGSAGAVKTEGEGETATAAAAREDKESVREKGLRLWQAAKDAVNKEGRTISHDFMRLPSRRQYPDYYQQIKRPIALDEIKAQLDALAYASFEDVRHDFDICFRNAKRYNIRESQIWKDAKQLHKIVSKEYSKITGVSEHDGADDGDEHANGGSDDEGGEKKKKTPNMNRLLKSRLQKLIEKTNDSGRVLSTEFMELPNRKQWPIYYKTIKRPQCLENIFKKLKRKEYHTSQDFANDVELVFSNALEFNQDHTPIWDDAMVLRNYFRQIMADLPHPYSIPAYTPELPAKIKLKVPAVTAAQSATPTAQVNGSPSAGTVRIPAHHPPATGETTSQSSPEPAKPPTIAPKPATTAPAASPAVQPPTPAPVPAVAQLRPVAPSTGTLQPANFSQPSYPPSYPSTHYPNVVYNQPAAALAASNPAPAAAAAQATAPAPAASTSRTTASPAATSERQLRKAVLVTKPLGRRLVLDQSDGVKTWAVRLAGETGVRVSSVKLQSEQDDEDASGGEDDENGEKEVVEEEVVEEVVEEEPKKRGRGRPRKKPLVVVVKTKSKGKAPAKNAPPEVQVKLNGVAVKSVPDAKGEWDVELPAGSNVLELGEKGGVAWRVYLDRLPT